MEIYFNCTHACVTVTSLQRMIEILIGKNLLLVVSGKITSARPE